MLEEITRVVFGPFEHQVLEEVGEASLVPFFILGTNVIPKVYGHEREFRLAADDDVEAVVQGRLGESKTVERCGIGHGRGRRQE